MKKLWWYFFWNDSNLLPTLKKNGYNLKVIEFENLKNSKYVSKY